MCGEHVIIKDEFKADAGSSPHVRGAHDVEPPGVLEERIIPACAGSTGQVTLQNHGGSDHPRMCGEHAVNAEVTAPTMGSSPHVRGARRVRPVARRGGRIIPACAGSTDAGTVQRLRGRDHPRMCGEHPGRRASASWSSGSSPHVRGAPPVRGPHPPRRRIIPACAGSTTSRSSCPPRSGDHPRMCGEHLNPYLRVSAVGGSSPHVRGAPRHAGEPAGVLGIIPACAGSTLGTLLRGCSPRDHPRMCGEHSACSHSGLRSRGSSPHVRGARHAVRARDPGRRIIPACAGSTSAARARPRSLRDHPRMCGEHTPPMTRPAKRSGSSPHVRGAQALHGPVLAFGGIIPACAGSTGSGRCGPSATRDHPRMCGEHQKWEIPTLEINGSSPHVRGAQRAAVRAVRKHGIIPACAGSTAGHPGQVPDGRDHPRMCGEHALCLRR